MQLPLYLFLDELSQTCTQISGAFDDDGALCDGVRLFSGDAVYEPNCLYVVQEEFMGDYFLFSKGHGFLPPAVLFCSGSADQFQIKNSVLCCSGESFFAFFNRLQSLCDRCSRLDLALTECNSRQAPYREYLDLCFPFIQNPIILYDHDYIIIADSRGLHPLPDDTDWINLTSAGYWTPEVRTTALLDMGEKKYPHNQAYYYDSADPIVFFSGQSIHQSQARDFNINFLKKDLSASIQQNDSERLGEIFRQIIDLFTQCRPSREAAASACINMYSYLSGFFEQSAEESQDIFPYTINIAGYITQFTSLADILAWLDSRRNRRES